MTPHQLTQRLVAGLEKLRLELGMNELRFSSALNATSIKLSLQAGIPGEMVVAATIAACGVLTDGDVVRALKEACGECLDYFEHEDAQKKVPAIKREAL